MKIIRAICISGTLLALTDSLMAVDPPRFTVSTAVGAGADAQLNEHSNIGSSSGSAGDLNTRTSSNGDRNEIVALRFDLSEHTLSSLTDVTLNIVNFRDNSARRVALYGVKQGSVGGSGVYSTEDWDESALTAFGDLPGLTATDGDFTTQNLNAEQLTFLGEITFSNLQKGTIETFSDPGLTAFIRSYTGSHLVTLILAAAPGYTSTGQARFASKEAVSLDGGSPTGNPGDFAPFLSFEQGGGSVPPSVLITAPVNGADVSMGVPIPIEVSVTDDGTIARVQFYAGTEEPLTLLGEDTSAPYTFTFTPPSAATYTIKAVATDNQSLAGEHSVTIDVGAMNPPAVTITSPAEDATILKDALIILAATVTDDVSVAKVEFFAGTTEPLTLIGEDATAPFTVQFTPTSTGQYTIMVVGTDNLGLTNSASRTVFVEEPAANLRTVSTATGLGLDVQANEHGGISTAGSDLNTRTSSAGDRNELVALRFDLSEYTLSELSDVTLNLINFRNNSARQVALYGVHQGAQGGTGLYNTEDWSEFELFEFGDIPGLEVTDGDFLTQSIDSTKVTPLGQITFANLTKGTTETFNDAALTDFIRSYSGSKLVTFIVAAAPGYTSTGQARFASKEAFGLEGDEPGAEGGRYAPYLTFVTGGAAELRITGVTPIGDELRLDWTGGSGPYTVQQKLELDAGEWVDAARDVNGTSTTLRLNTPFAFFRVLGQ